VKESDGSDENDENAEQAEPTDADDDQGQGDAEDDISYAVGVRFRHMSCMAHTLQLIVKSVFKTHYRNLITKARSLVGHVKKSSVAVEKMTATCGKTLVSDNQTRWNSTYDMLCRMIELRSVVNEVLADMKLDSLRISEWEELGQFKSLLQPFAEQTDLLQSDALSLSYIIPALLELKCHLEQFPSSKPLTRLMLIDIEKRFSGVLQPAEANFNPLPAAACLLDPTVASVLLTRDMQPLLNAAKQFHNH
jgi:hypothetical protein